MDVKTKNKVIIAGGSSLAIIVSFGHFYLDWQPILLLTIGAIFFVAMVASWLETKEMKEEEEKQDDKL